MTLKKLPLACALVMALAACGSSSTATTTAINPVTATTPTTPTNTIDNATCARAYTPPVAIPGGGLAFCAKLATAPDANGVGSENGKSCQARSSAMIVREMGQGWNLGNTLDATGNTANPLADETYWGNPKTGKAMIDAVRKAGFTTMRLPVSWDDHVSGSARTIDPAWMDRVEEVARYALDNGMTVIVNIHHQSGWEAPTLANEADAKAALGQLWTQIASRFAAYDHHLVFEAMNEPRVSLNGKDDWVGKAEYYDVLNRLNASALAAIRATGGNNARRLVMLPSYAAAPGTQQLAPLVLPADRMIALSSHAYSPYDFALNQAGSPVFSGEAELDQLFDRLNKMFVARGVPVVMGEWASTDKGNAAERVKHASYFVKGAKRVGIPTIWWDNGSRVLTSTSTDVMALLNRTDNTWVHPEINNAIFCAAQ
jgi:endoglucanase